MNIDFQPVTKRQRTLPLMTAADYDIAARTIYGEARGETLLGKVAVCLVMINRWMLRKGDRDHCLAAVCLRAWQFSAWLEDDPNRPTMQAVHYGDPVFRECLLAVTVAVALWEQGEDFTHGARHYHTTAISPKWAEGETPDLTIGAHHFYAGIA